MMSKIDGQQRTILVVAMILSTLPFWFVAIPPLNDLPGHMGRYHLQLALRTSAALQANWDLHWMLIGNLGVDLVMQVVGPIAGVERGTWLVVMAIPPLMIWGLVRLANAFHGHVPASVVAAFPLVFAYPFQTGLVNFWLAVALAFHASASVIGNPERWARPLLLGGSSVLLWICHIYGWAIFVGIVAVARLVDRRDVGLGHRFAGLWPLAAPIALMLYQSYGQHATAKTLGWFAWTHKLRSLTYVLRDQHQALDIASVILVMIPVASALILPRRHSFDLRALLAAGGLLVALMVIPYQLFGSAWADARLWPVVMMLLILAVAPRRDSGRLWTTFLPTFLLALFFVRVGVDAQAYRDYNRDYARHLKVLDELPNGSRVAFLISTPCDLAWRRHRLEHIDGLAIVRRDAFTNGQWEVPGAETVEPLAARGTYFNSDPSQLVRQRPCTTDLRPRLAFLMRNLPQDRFDYVWIMGFAPDGLPDYRWLEPVFANDQSILYRIAK